MTPLTIVVDATPPSALLPNAARRTDYRRKADLSRPLRELAKWRAIETALLFRYLNGGVLFDGPVTLRVVVSWEKGRRMPDCSGLGLAVKAMEDGLTDAQIWRDDSQVVEACYRQEKSPDGIGRTTFTVTEAS